MRKSIYKQIKDRIGIVMDESYFYNDLSMKEMKSILAPAYTRWSDEDYQAWMDKFELDPAQKIGTLSRGMKMKFALVLALSHQAELLIMDEPTSGLDPLARNQFLEIVMDYMRKWRKRCLLLHTHYNRFGKDSGHADSHP
jgi:ABC-2 type transport system ATP-binding protein